ncbi:MAG: polysaccharide deacetylase family protein [Clostridiales bacterium]|nr:polysaccharide deacetylase family protein [Clostridiales bacterium]
MKNYRIWLSLAVLLTAASCSACGQSSEKLSQTTSQEEQTANTRENSSSLAAEEDTELLKVTIPGLENGDEVYRSIMESQTEETDTVSDEKTGSSSETNSSSDPTVKTFSQTGKPAVALTFDDGPGSDSTNRILDVLEENSAHATFFIVGENASKNPEALQREVSLGCELGSHTNTHAALSKLSEDEVNNEMSQSIASIEEASGGKVTVMRPPWGDITASLKESLDIPIILWSLDTLDWKTRDADATCQNIKENVKGGDIILMHDIHSETADAVEEIVPWLIKNGYELLTVSELYDYYEADLSLHKGHGSAQ